MKTRALIQNSLLHIDTVKLGRLVLNAKHPQQAFYDPFDSPPEFTVKQQDNFQGTLSLSKNSQLRSRLTALLLVSYENRDANAITLAATQAKTYQLLNSGAWFRKACSSAETRQWFEDAIGDGDGSNVYLVVGYHTITDARVTKTTISGGTTSGGVHLRGSSLVGGTTPSPTAMVNALNSRVNSTRDVNNRSEKSFDAPGEQIYAIQYRKVEFKFFSSRSLEKASLERDNRWKTFWSDDVRGSLPTEVEDDVLEADLTDELELEYDETYASEDGTEEFIF